MKRWLGTFAIALLLAVGSAPALAEEDESDVDAVEDAV